MKNSSILLLVLMFSNIAVIVFSAYEISNLHSTIAYLSEKKKHQPEYWPLPKDINIEPQSYYSEEGKQLFKYDDPLRKKYALHLVNENGQYIWKSNDNKKLNTVIQWHKQPLIMAALLDTYKNLHDLSFIPEIIQNRGILRWGKITIFKAHDQSGIIVIKHDYYRRHACSDMGRDDAWYWEFRFDTKEIFQGPVISFPPKPKDWCSRRNIKDFWKYGL